MVVNFLFCTLTVAIKYWQKEKVESEDWNSIVSDSYLPESMFEEIFAGILRLSLAVLRLPAGKYSDDVLVRELVSYG